VGQFWTPILAISGSLLHADSHKYKNSFCGYHAATSHLGNRIDVSDNDGEASIVGILEGEAAKIKFFSGYSEATGIARIEIKGNKLYWRITNEADGEHYLPFDAVLTKVKDENDYKSNRVHKKPNTGSTGSLRAP